MEGSIISLLGISALKVRKLSLDTENLATSPQCCPGLLAAVCFIPEQEHTYLTISGIRQYLLRKGGKSNPLRNEDINKQGRNR